MSKLKEPPFSAEAEELVLGCILIDGDAMGLVLELVDTKDFYVEVNRRLFLTMQSMAKAGEPIETATLFARLKNDEAIHEAGGVHHILSLGTLAATATSVKHYAQIVKDKSVLRQMLKLAGEIQHKVFTDLESVPDFVGDVEKRFCDLAQQDSRKAYYSAKEVVTDALEGISERFENKQTITGVASGFFDLDDMTSGFQRGDLVILAARPSMGKTALALNIATNAALKSGTPTAFFSLEMGKEQLISRVLCSEARVDASRLRCGRLADAEWGRLIQSSGPLGDSPIYIDDTPALSIMKLQAKARRIKAERGLGLILVDYLQLMKANGNIRSREQAISEISRSLKTIAKELDVPVVALSQLNRGVDSRPDKRPLLSDLRESGAIEQDADVILFIYRDEVYDKETQDKGIAEVIVSKQRNGATGTVKLKWFGHFTRFENIARNTHF